MSTNDDKSQKKAGGAEPTPDESDTEGHGLLLDTDFYINRKMGREAELEREARERRRVKEARPNKADR